MQAFHAIACLGTAGHEISEQRDFTEIIMRCIKQHSDNIELVSGALHAVGALAGTGKRHILRFLTSSCSLSTGITAFHQHKDSLVTTILQSMRHFQNRPTFQITACFALAHIFFNFTIRDEIITELRGIEGILSAMRIYPDNESLQTTAIFALGAIVMKHECHRLVVLKEIGIQLILRAMTANFKQEDASKKSSRSGKYTYERNLADSVKPFCRFNRVSAWRGAEFPPDCTRTRSVRIFRMNGY